MKKQLMLVITFLLMGSTYASSSIVSSKTFRCSNGRNYDIAIRTTGGWGNDQWDLQGLCSRGTLTQKSYSGRHIDENFNVDLPDINRCRHEDKPALRVCYNEFSRLNGTRGSGRFSHVRHGRNDTRSENPMSNCEIVTESYVVCNGVRYERSTAINDDMEKDLSDILNDDNMMIFLPKSSSNQ
jgi:hypothetical protein